MRVTAVGMGVPEEKRSIYDIAARGRLSWSVLI